MEHIKEIIVVEGRYDKNTLSQAVDAIIIETNGFSIFNDREKTALIRRLGEDRGVIILTDSDGAGFLIRNHLKGSLHGIDLKEAYIPDVYGKEKRKRTASKEGKLGVEGMTKEVILSALRRAGATFLADEPFDRKNELTKYDLYELGLSGGENSEERRKALLKRIELPERLSTKALFEVLRVLYTKEELLKLVVDNSGGDKSEQQ